jgi:hypothetical protein
MFGLILGLSVAFGSIAIAAPVTRMLEATFNHMKLVIDGTAFTAKDDFGNDLEPFIIDGYIYLPAHVIAVAFNKELSYDESTKTLRIFDPVRTVERTPLTSLTRLERTSGALGWGTGDTDNSGEKYVSGTKFPRSPWAAPRVTYNIGGNNFTKLTATITPFEGGNHTNRIAFYSVTDTSIKKLHETDVIRQTTKPFSVTVDVTGVDTLRITNAGGWTLGVAVVDAFLE